jgi:hypothetical protein
MESQYDGFDTWFNTLLREKSENNDAVVFQKQWDKNVLLIWVFNPTQIKSAIEATGTFNPDVENIYNSNQYNFSESDKITNSQIFWTEKSIFQKEWVYDFTNSETLAKFDQINKIIKEKAWEEHMIDFTADTDNTIKTAILNAHFSNGNITTGLTLRRAELTEVQTKILMEANI